ncbi:PREDICTED: uncharacterized protein LOC109181252 [Ipomoea nil]|uniref:uncharacterized protein LOC109181252 n=1 Tax=Ipomoea nil TaxID=35883 RepID=UPI000901B171|nr:PREDICTED: uncharacterized protein LOC109181252 [Ipomoea nil]
MRSVGSDFQQRILECGRSLFNWGGDYYNKFGRRIQHLRNRLKILRDNRNPTAVNEYLSTQHELTVLSSQEELYWRQRAKQLWLKEGDSNTNYFHKSASARKRSNYLKRIKNADDDWVEGPSMKAVILEYYCDIFKTASTSVNFLHHVQKRVTDDMNSRLLRPFTHEEVKDALFQMAPEKAPGPDGMTPAFYQRFWPVVGHDLCCFVLDCLNRRYIPEGLNNTTIVLIPKKKVPEKVGDLRPIALCNVAYKVLAKVLANRLKEVLEGVISSTQNAFIKNRLLSDNILLAGEIGHYLRRTRQGTMDWAALKLDMAKAYDRMKWSFLEAMFGGLGFDPAWVQLLLMCVTTISYNITVNDEPTGNVVPTRGIRQGDPLSPYLFIICAEGLSTLLNRAESCGDMHGIKIARNAPSINHLLFADDCLLFFRACPREMEVVKDTLDDYCVASGQRINFDKSNIMFSASTPTNMWDFIAEYLDVRQTDDLGKEILLKSIGKALPIFTMSAYLLPLSICESLERLMNRFWWENNDTTALLAKQGWRLMTCPGSLVTKVIKARYYPHSDFLEAELGNNPSYLWRSILATKSVLREGMAKRIGNGRNTKVWGAPWLLDKSNPTLNTPIVDELREAPVSGLLTTNGEWDIEVLQDIFVAQDIPRILATPVSVDYEDEWYWKDDINGRYTVSHGYRSLMANRETSESHLEFTEWKLLWKLSVPPKVKNFLWRFLRKVLPVRENLNSKHVYEGGGCPFCAYEYETIEHLFCECQAISPLWGGSGLDGAVNLYYFMNVAVVTFPIAERIKTYVQEGNTSTQSPPVSNHTPGWSPPPVNFLKCNVDATIFADGAGFGAVVRDEEGRFVAACSARLNCQDDPFMAETMAVKEALKWLKTNRFNNVILETDCLNFCSAFNSYIGNLRVRHVNRSANHIAHVLARASDSLSALGSWFTVTPACISFLFDVQ